jgi:hypothetical protein
MLIACGETLGAFLEGRVDADEAIARLPVVDPLHPCAAFVALLGQALLECSHNEDDRDREELPVVRSLLLGGQLPDTSALEWFKPQPWWALQHRIWLRRVPESSHTLLIYGRRDADALALPFLRTARHRRLVVYSASEAVDALGNVRPEVLVTDLEPSAPLVTAVEHSETAVYVSIDHARAASAGFTNSLDH